MPNWVFNGLTIEGNPESVTKLINQVGKSFTNAVETHGMGDLAYAIKEVTFTNPVFAFHNIISYKDMGVTDEEYATQPARSKLSPSDPNWWADTNELAKSDNSWYSWNNQNWGCKWDVAVADDQEYPDTYMEGPTANGDNLVVYYNFNTPWGIAEPVLEKLSSQYPDLLLTLSYEEETGWGGEREYLRGECISESEYNWKCRECDYEETGEPPYCDTCEYDMCPDCGYGEPMEEDRAQCEEHRVEKVEA